VQTGTVLYTHDLKALRHLMILSTLCSWSPKYLLALSIRERSTGVQDWKRLSCILLYHSADRYLRKLLYQASKYTSPNRLEEAAHLYLSSCRIVQYLLRSSTHGSCMFLVFQTRRTRILSRHSVNQEQIQVFKDISMHIHGKIIPMYV